MSKNVLHPNPFAGPIPFNGRGRINVAQVEATLAVAHELRTANLIAYAAQADDETADRLWTDHITPRLGLDGGDEK